MSITSDVKQEFAVGEALAFSDFSSVHSGMHSQLNNWGGGVRIFIYSCSALLISFEIDCFYGE